MLLHPPSLLSFFLSPTLLLPSSSFVLLLSSSPGVVCFEERIEWCCSQLREELVRLNDAVHSQVHRQLDQAIHNLVSGIRYQFLEPHGPHREYITRDNPLFPE